jgi:mono/diheme cytochrome c family protein
MLTFEEHVRPLLKAHCFDCHGEGTKPKGGLDVRLTRFMVQGGDSGPAFVAGKAKESVLIDRLAKGEMPPGKKKLTAKEIDVIRRWIDQGAKTLRPEPEKIAQGFHVTPEDEAFWSFQPVRAHEPPVVKNAQQVRTPIDAFLLAKLEEKGLKFSPEADRRTLIRRAYFDLIGLPPSPKEVDDFVHDRSENAFERVVDRLLESPHYGERWGRHWLDVAGYADSEGFTGEDVPRKSAWKYRDYVIRSFNADKPWNEFLREQIAGDEMVPLPYDKLPASELDKLIATGFLRMAPDGSASKDVDLPASTNQTIADTIQIVSTAILGVTVHCAQCHNHRYDPIPQSDYYQIRAIFEPALDWKNWRKPPAREVGFQSPADKKKADDLEKEAVKIDAERVKKEQGYVRAYLEEQIKKLPADVQAPIRKAYDTPAAKRTKAEAALLVRYPNIAGINIVSVGRRDKKVADEIAAYKSKADALRAQKPDLSTIRALTEIPGKVPTTYFFDRGDYQAPKDAVVPGTLTILEKYKLGTIPEDDPKLPTTGRRLAFARWLTHDAHPLTPRALVNRFWMHHFDRGIVATPSDFGALGDRPSHPELLDWLASDFIQGGWKLKRLHKLIMTSTAYRQISTRTPALQQIDPDNVLLGRMSVRRLDAEIVRDAMLAVSGKLNTKPYGPPVPVKTDDQGQVIIGVDTDDAAGRPTGKVVPLNGEEFRRSLYVAVRRSKPLAMLETFDGAMVTPNCECRVPTTVAPQSLMLMNSRSVIEQAEFFAERLTREAGTDAKLQVKLAWNHALGPDPSNADAATALRFLAEQTKIYQGINNLPAGQDAAQAALTNLCQALLSSNAFLYVD